MIFVFFIALLVYLLVCIVLVSLILMQEGKGGGLSGVMGASVGETFGFGGASKQIRKYTGICATIFFVLTILITFIAESALRTTGSRFVGDTTAAPVPAATAPTATAPDEVSPGSVPVQSGEAQTITITPAAGDAAPAATAVTPAP